MDGPIDQPAASPAQPADSTASAPPTVRGTAPIYQRPATWPTAIGVIGLVLAAFAALQNLWGVVSIFFMDQITAAMPQTGPGAAGMAAVKQYLPIQAGVAFLALVVSGLLLAGSIQLLQRRPVAVMLLKVWAYSKIACAGLQIIVQYWIQTAQFQAMSTSGTPMPAGLLTGMVAVTLVISLAWYGLAPGFILIWLARRPVKDEVARWSRSGADRATRTPAAPPHAM